MWSPAGATSNHLYSTVTRAALAFFLTQAWEMEKMVLSEECERLRRDRGRVDAMFGDTTRVSRVSRVSRAGVSLLYLGCTPHSWEAAALQPKGTAQPCRGQHSQGHSRATQAVRASRGQAEGKPRASRGQCLIVMHAEKEFTDMEMDKRQYTTEKRRWEASQQVNAALRVAACSCGHPRGGGTHSCTHQGDGTHSCTHQGGWIP